MLKKIIPIFICLAFLALPSCAKPPVPKTFGGVPCPIAELQWGMSLVNCLDSLAISMDNVKIVQTLPGDEDGSFDTQSVLFDAPKDMRIYGYPVVRVFLEFWQQTKTQKNIGLVDVTLDFGKDLPVEALQRNVEKLTARFVVRRNGRLESLKTLEDTEPLLAYNYFNDQTASGHPAEERDPYGVISVGRPYGYTSVKVNNAIAMLLHSSEKDLEKTEKVYP